MLSDPTKDIARSQGTYKYMLKISDQLHCFNLFSANGVHRAKNVKVEKTIFRQNLEKYAKIRKFDNFFENCLVMATNDKNTRETFFRYTTTLTFILLDLSATLFSGH